MTKEFIIKGRSASGSTETINLSGSRPGYGFQLHDFKLWGSNNLGNTSMEGWATLARSSTGISPIDPDFSNDALVAVAVFMTHTSPAYPPQALNMINDLVILTQDLTLMVQDTGDGDPINYMLKFKEVKLSDAREAVSNYQAFTVRD
jgi:hypothetical protein